MRDVRRSHFHTLIHYRTLRQNAVWACSLDELAGPYDYTCVHVCNKCAMACFGLVWLVYRVLSILAHSLDPFLSAARQPTNVLLTGKTFVTVDKSATLKNKEQLAPLIRLFFHSSFSSFFYHSFSHQRPPSSLAHNGSTRPLRRPSLHHNRIRVPRLLHRPGPRSRPRVKKKHIQNSFRRSNPAPVESQTNPDFTPFHYFLFGGYYSITVRNPNVSVPLSSLSHKEPKGQITTTLRDTSIALFSH